MRNVSRPTSFDREKLKFCPKCKKVKKRAEFHKSKQLRDGLYSYCKDCNKKKRADWYAKNGDIVRENARIYRIENNEEVTRKNREKYQKNIENCRLIARRSHSKNKEKINQKRREEYQSNPQKRKALNTRNNEWAKNNKEKIEHRRKKYYRENKNRIREKANEKSRLLTREQKDKINARQRKWYSKNKETEAAKQRIKRNNDISIRLSNNIGTAIRHAIKGKKAGRRWESLVGYTVQDLMKHIEGLFTEEMSWECFMRGEIHIDHKIPLVLFDFASPEDRKFKAAWSLKNLQPLWANDNLEKQDKILYPELLIELLFD